MNVEYRNGECDLIVQGDRDFSGLWIGKKISISGALCVEAVCRIASMMRKMILLYSSEFSSKSQTF